MSTVNFHKSPGKRPITFCRGLTHWLSKTEFESVKASGMFGEFYPDQPDRWEDLPNQDPATPSPTPLASTAMEAAREIVKTGSDWLNRRIEWSENDLNWEIAKRAAIIQKHFQPLLAKVEETETYLASRKLIGLGDGAFAAVDQPVVDLVIALRAELAAKETALAFYADPQSYGLHGGSSARIILDAGKTARSALASRADNPTKQ